MEYWRRCQMKKNEKSYCDWNGSELREKRKLLGLSQIVMAQKLGLSERGYRCYETDTYQIPIPIKYAVLYLMNDGEASKSHAEVRDFDENDNPLSEFDKQRIWKLSNAISHMIPEAEKMNDRVYVSKVLLQCDKEMQLMLSKMN
jgi:transcriptional regulator with XRE-family HTH domain